MSYLKLGSYFNCQELVVVDYPDDAAATTTRRSWDIFACVKLHTLKFRLLYLSRTSVIGAN